MKEICDLIANVGFPIATCLCLMWYVKDLTTKHKAETDSFTVALNKNTIILQKLCDALNVERSEDDEKS